MIKSKNLVLYEIIAVICIFTIIYFVTVTKVSYAFSYDGVEDLYNNKINLINKNAQLYGEQNQDLFADEDTIYLTVGELVEHGYLLADDDHGNVKDPTSDVKLLNDLRIRITYKDGKINTKILT